MTQRLHLWSRNQRNIKQRSFDGRSHHLRYVCWGCIIDHRHGKEASRSLLLLRVQSLLELFDTPLPLPLLVCCRG